MQMKEKCIQCDQEYDSLNCYLWCSLGCQAEYQNFDPQLLHDAPHVDEDAQHRGRLKLRSLKQNDKDDQ